MRQDRSEAARPEADNRSQQQTNCCQSAVSSHQEHERARNLLATYFQHWVPLNNLREAAFAGWAIVLVGAATGSNNRTRQRLGTIIQALMQATDQTWQNT